MTTYSPMTRTDTTTREAPESSCMYRRASSSTVTQPPQAAGRRTTIGDGSATAAPAAFSHVCASSVDRSTGWTISGK